MPCRSYYFDNGIFKGRTIDDRLMHITDDDNQNYPFGRLRLLSKVWNQTIPKVLSQDEAEVRCKYLDGKNGTPFVSCYFILIQMP